MPRSQAELALELAALRKKLSKVLGEARPADQIANINFRIEVRSVIRYERK